MGGEHVEYFGSDPIILLVSPSVAGLKMLLLGVQQRLTPASSRISEFVAFVCVSEPCNQSTSCDVFAGLSPLHCFELRDGRTY